MASGLTSVEAAERHQLYGLNQLAEAQPEPWWRTLLAQFQQLVVWILIVAAVISGIIGDWTDALAILAIVLLNGFIGYFQESRAARAVEALRKLSTPVCKVRRDGVLTSLPAEQLTLGDVIEVEAGDHIPADARLVSAFGVTVQEAALTGESTTVAKDATAVCSANTPIGDRINMLHLGTTVATGKAVAVVAAIGMQTELGQIAGLLQHAPVEQTPLQRRLEELGRVLITVCLTLVAIIFVLQWLRGGDLTEMILMAASLAVAAVPEGLPAVVTITLAIGLQRMVRRNALIRRLPSVETLGAVTVICSDKTGTLTRNEMTVREMVVGPDRYQVTGSGYALQGEIRPRDPARGTDSACQPDLGWALTIGALCNNARIAPSETGDAWTVIGDPTEGALLILSRKLTGENPQSLGQVVYEIPFDSERKVMSIVYRRPDGTDVLLLKGAPEMVLARCVSERHRGTIKPLDDARRDFWNRCNADLAGQALRVLALAYREHPGPVGEEAEESSLVFVGLVGMIDPPRDEVKLAVARCRDAGIRPVMITGDHPATALAIGLELGLAHPDQKVVTGVELSQLTDAELESTVPEAAVFARVSAEHKLRIVNAWKRRGEVVAMTGDGVNDAPAVQAADIGIAMGITGTDVTKEASDMVLLDDNFTSIVNAVEEGRGIFDNIQKFVHYLLACNAGEVLFVFAATLIGWPAPLQAIQMLWINLITDGIPALALAMEPLERDVMQRPPRKPRTPVITGSDGIKIVIHGLLIAGVAMICFGAVYRPSDPTSLPHAQTAAFCVMAYTQLFYALACRSPQRIMPAVGWFTNPLLLGAIVFSGLLQAVVVMLPATQPLLEVQPGGIEEWFGLLALALVPVTIVEVAKLIRHATTL